MQTRAEQEAAVQHYYNHIVAEEECLVDTYPFELAITLRFIRQYLAPGAKLLDVACGTGRDADALLAAGYVAGASDLAEANVQHTHHRLHAGPYRAQLLFVRQGNALDPPTYAGGPWDGILLLGRASFTGAARRGAVLHGLRRISPLEASLIRLRVRRAAFGCGSGRRRPEGILEQEGVRTLYHEGTTFNFALPGEGLPNGYFCILLWSRSSRGGSWAPRAGTDGALAGAWRASMRWRPRSRRHGSNLPSPTAKPQCSDGRRSISWWWRSGGEGMACRVGLCRQHLTNACR